MDDQEKTQQQVQDDIERRSIGREILSAAAQEMGFAVNSIRQEVVEKGWYGEKVTPEITMQWEREEAKGDTVMGPQDFSREDLYGRDQDGSDLDRDHDQEIER